METLREKRMSSTNIKEKSWKQYARNINKLTKGITGYDYKNNEFLLVYKVVNDWINSNSSSDAMKRMFYSVILIMLAPDKKNTQAQQNSTYKHYQKKLAQLAQNYNEEKSNQQKSVKENKNWEDWSWILALQKKMAREMFKVVDKIKGKKILSKERANINRKQRTLIQNALIISLYTLIKPRRLDYADMKIITIKNYNNMGKDDKEQSNYLVITGKNKKFFSFGKQSQKNQNTDRNGVKQSVMILSVPPKLNKVINTYLLFHPEKAFKKAFLTRPFLYNTRGNAITGDGLSKAVIKIMKANFNKNISPSMLRTIYLSDKHKNDVSVKEKQTTAEEMGHTINTAQKHYQKK